MTRLTKRAASGVALLLFCTLIATPATAQTTDDASILAIAHVTTGYAALAVTSGDALEFNDVVAGTPVAAASAGTFTVLGEAAADVTLDFVLPTELTRTLGGTIPISFGAADGSWDDAASTGVFNPNGSAPATLGAAGQLTVGINGTVAPPVGTVAGDYEGTITLTVTYVL